MLYKYISSTMIFNRVFVWLFLLCFHLSQPLEIKKIKAVEGGIASLPCDFQHPPDDSVFLILWFKSNLTTPIYNYDSRPGNDGSNWSDDSVLGERATLDISSNPARLKLTSVRASDAGFYKCRVDFAIQPTKTTRVSLSVIVPPKSLTITMEEGRAVKSVIGPYKEGDTASLTCIAHGGVPTPTIVWYYAGQLIDKQMDVEEEEEEEEEVDKNSEVEEKMLFIGPTNSLLHGQSYTLIQGPVRSIIHPIKKKVTRSLSSPGYAANTLHLGPFRRSDLKKLATCEATNTNMTSPLSEAVMIDMNLEPVSVELLGPEEPLSYGRSYKVVCDVRGSRPPPEITWWAGTKRAQGAVESTTKDGNVTTSTLTLTPTPPDDGTKIMCRAKNPTTNTVLEQYLPLTVHYVPESHVKLGRSLDPQNIKEGDDVYFECSIQANPRAYKVIWTHNGRLLKHNITARVIITNQSLVLQTVTRRHGGKYSCTASNIEGDGASTPITLDIKYAPVCAPGQMLTYGVARDEDAEVTCKVAANPPADTFKWTFNNTADTIDVPPGRFTITPTHSIITYTPKTELDYGTLLCWADNQIGKQDSPCVFHIVPAGKPDPPGNCSVTNQTATSFSVACQAGFDGGLKQIFLLRVAQPGLQGHNLSAEAPLFQVNELLPDTTYRLQVWAANDKGVSPSVHLQAFTTHPPTREDPVAVAKGVLSVGSGEGGGGSGGSNGVGSVSSRDSIGLLGEEVGGVPALVSVVVGASVGILLLLLLLALLLRQRVRRPQPPPAPKPAHAGQARSPQPILKTTHQSTHDCEEREMQVESEAEVDPDLIPQQVAHSTLTLSGPVLIPPANYRSADPSFCEVVPRGVMVGVGGGGGRGGGEGGEGGGVGGGGGGGSRGVHHQLVVSYPPPPSSSLQASSSSPQSSAVTTTTAAAAAAAAAAVVVTPHHHHHLLPRHQYHHNPVVSDPRFAHLDLEHGGGHTQGVVVPGGRVVPTVYATLDTRHSQPRHAQVTFDLRHSHSQASLDLSRAHDLAYSSGQGHHHHEPQQSTHDIAYAHHHHLGHGLEQCRPLLEDEVTIEAPLVTKRESSV